MSVGPPRTATASQRENWWLELLQAAMGGLPSTTATHNGFRALEEVAAIRFSAEGPNVSVGPPRTATASQRENWWVELRELTVVSILLGQTLV